MSISSPRIEIDTGHSEHDYSEEFRLQNAYFFFLFSFFLKK